MTDDTRESSKGTGSEVTRHVTYGAPACRPGIPGLKNSCTPFWRKPPRSPLVLPPPPPPPPLTSCTGRPRSLHRSSSSPPTFGPLEGPVPPCYGREGRSCRPRTCQLLETRGAGPMASQDMTFSNGSPPHIDSDRLNRVHLHHVRHNRCPEPSNVPLHSSQGRR